VPENPLGHTHVSEFCEVTTHEPPCMQGADEHGSYDERGVEQVGPVKGGGQKQENDCGDDVQLPPLSQGEEAHESNGASHCNPTRPVAHAHVKPRGE